MTLIARLGALITAIADEFGLVRSEIPVLIEETQDGYDTLEAGDDLVPGAWYFIVDE